MAFRFKGPWRLALVLSWFYLGQGCASKIPQTFGLPPRPQTSTFDANKVVFGSLDGSRQKTSLADLMTEEGYDYVLLTFGSKACAACNRKAEELTRNVIGRHPLYLTGVAKTFAVVGVNTDPYPERLAGFLKQFPFIKWSDPSGEAMVQHFLGEGETFRVPLTVLVSRKDGILWRVGADDPTSVGQIMDRVALSLQSLTTVPAPPKPQDEPPPPPPREEVPPTTGAQLADMDVTRFKAVPVAACGEPNSNQTLASAFGLASPMKPLWVQVVRGVCDQSCLDQHDQLTELCQSEASLTACQNVTLIASGPSSSEPRCERKHIMRGGDEFFGVFASLFDWRYPRSTTPEGYVLIDRKDRGPQVFLFGVDGKLRYSVEGVEPQGVFKAVLDGSTPQASGGADFNLVGSVGSEPAPVSFASLRQKSRYTALAFFQTDCSSCELELKEWSLAGGLVDFCQAHADFCQVYAVENRFRPQGWTVEEFYKKLVGGYQNSRWDFYLGFIAMGIRVPLLLDSTPDDDGVDSYKNRLHDGYLLAASPSLGNGYRIVVYDQEGKYHKIFESKAPETGKKDELTEFLTSRFELGK